MRVGVVNRIVLRKLRDEYGIFINPDALVSEGTIDAEFGPIHISSHPLIPSDTMYVMDVADVRKFYEETDAAWDKIKAGAQ